MARGLGSVMLIASGQRFCIYITMAKSSGESLWARRLGWIACKVPSFG